MKITADTYRDATLDDWTENFWAIYRQQDETLRLDEVWSEAARDATKVEEAIREGDLQNALDAIAHTFCWISCFVEKLRTDGSVASPFKMSQASTLSEIVWFKYPRACATCQKANCWCPLLPHEEKKSKDKIRSFLQVRRQKAGAVPGKVAEWEGMFSTIYDTAHFIKDIRELVAHYLEEVGEVIGAIRNLSLPCDSSKLVGFQEDLIEELADTVSWTFSLVRKVQQEVGNIRQAAIWVYRDRHTIDLPDISVAELLWATYKLDDRDELGCPSCHKPVCDPEMCRIGPRVFVD